MAKILIGIPSFGSMPPETETDYMRFMYYLGRRYQEHEFFLVIRRKSEQFRARNSIVALGYRISADYILMLDDDHVIDVQDSTDPSPLYEFLRTLISHMEADKNIGIVGALYYHRGGECRPVLMSESEKGYSFLRDDQIKHGLQEVDVQGGGCMLIRMSVFDKIGSEPFEPEHEYGTDIQICRKTKAAGFKVMCDTSLTIGHVLDTRLIVTKHNRHLHFAETASNNDELLCRYGAGKILTEFRADVMEYLGLDAKGMAELANMYNAHQKSFNSYRDSNNLREYYKDSGSSYLARATFIHSAEHHPKFDDFVLQVVKTEYPGVGVDFGCGSAPITFEFARRGHIMHFIDIDGSAPFEFLKWRAKKYGLYGTKAIFNAWPESADYILALDSIEHLENWEATIKLMASKLRHAGCLITNFLLLGDTTNVEHIFMNKAEFMKCVTKGKLFPLNAAIFQKREDIKDDSL